MIQKGGWRMREIKTIPDVIDNTNYKLSDVLNEFINENSSVYIATAYFNLEGFKLVKDSLKKAKEVKILIGKDPEKIISTETLESILQEEIEEKVDEKETRNLLDEFLSFIRRSEVEIKIYKDGFFHGKFYIIDGGIPTISSVAIVGSSNFTYAGLTREGEFNSVLKQDSAVSSHKKIFFEYFNQRCDDYKENLISFISNFHSQYSPYDVYMKILYSYFEDKLSESPSDEMPSPIILADFQKDGYLSALQALEKYGGVILADSVGLGKTYLALRLLDDFAYRLRQKALIICPAQIRDTLWEPKLREFSIRADVISQESVSRDFNPDEFSDYDIIVIDESHNFRNSNTKRWKNLFEAIIKGKNNKKIILITATPVNNSVFDLYNQIRFICKDNDEFFKPAGITSLWGYFLKSDRDRETLFDLLEEIAVRRSRQFIKKFYPNATIDGEKIKFPERELHTIKYKLTEVYSGIYSECEKLIESLQLASYNLDSYRKDIFQRKLRDFEQIKKYLTEQGWAEEKIHQLLMKLGRNESVIAILKILFLKRLESSVEAFRISVERLLDFQRKFLEFLEKGILLDRETYSKIYLSQTEDDNGESLPEISLDQIKNINPDEYEIEEIKIKTLNDIKILEKLKQKLSLISEDNDSKLQKLVKTLQSLKNKKIVIFGYFKDTMRYIYNYITREDIISKIGISSDKISIVDSDIPPLERKNRIIRFSPLSNGHPEIKGTDQELQILISTDVLSEGQNLQDADTIINYDLPWNPVKIIQRIGRLDRIGSPHDTIHVYNFFPEDELESILNLLKRLYNKLEAINRSVGLDVSVLGETPNPKDFGYITDIFDAKKEVLDELEEISEIAIGEFLKDEILKYIQSEGTKKLQKIPNGVGSGIKREGKKGVFVAFKNDKHYWCFYDLETGKIIENRLECIRLIKCDKNEPYVPPPDDLDVYQIIRKVKNHIISRLKTQEVKPQKLKAPQSYIVNWLQSIGEPAKHLLQYFSNPLPDIYLKELKKLWNLSRNLKPEEIIKQLDDFKNVHPIEIVTQNPQKESTEKEIKLKLVGFITITD
jgi:superfamily II DNA or RNA helicase